MRKKNFWVITQVVIGRVSYSIDTYNLGYFNSFDKAKSFLEEKYNRLCNIGYEPSGFLRNDWGWTYKSETFVEQYVISLATAG